MNAMDVLQVLHRNPQEIFDPSEVADYFNGRRKNYDKAATVALKMLRKMGYVSKELREPFIGYIITPAGAALAECWKASNRRRYR